MKAFLLRALHSKPGHWAACLLVSVAYLQLLYRANIPEGTSVWMLPLLLALPGLLTFIMVPKSYRKWYRWAVLLFLSMTVEPPALMPLVLGIGIAWALYRSWFTERPVPLKKMFAPRKDSAPKKPTTVAEVLALEKKTATPTATPAKLPTKKDRAAKIQAAKSATIKDAAKTDS